MEAGRVARTYRAGRAEFPDVDAARHPAVSLAAEIAKAFIVLNPG